MIPAITSATTLTPASAIAAVGTLVLAQLAERAIAEATAHLGQKFVESFSGFEVSSFSSSGPAETFTFPREDVFSPEQRAEYLRTGSTKSLPTSQGEMSASMVFETEFPKPADLLIEKLNRLRTAALHYASRTDTASIKDKPLLYQQAVWSSMKLLGEPVDESFSGLDKSDIESLRKMAEFQQHRYTLRTAESCKEAAYSIRDPQERLAYLFRGIAALQMKGSQLEQPITKLAIGDLQNLLEKYDLGIQLWQDAGFMLQQPPVANAQIDFNVLPYQLFSAKDGEIFSNVHAAARCFRNQAVALQHRWYVFSNIDKNSANLEPERKKFRTDTYNALTTSIELLKQVIVDTPRQKAALQEETMKTCQERHLRFVSSADLTDSNTAMQLFTMNNEVFAEARKTAHAFAFAATQETEPAERNVLLAKQVPYLEAAADLAPTGKEQVLFLKQALEIAKSLNHPLEPLKTLLKNAEQRAYQESSWSEYLLSFLPWRGNV